MKTCVLCDWPVYTRGYCQRDYARLLNRGELKKITPEDRFWPRVQKTDTCWIWTGSSATGYGVFKGNNKRQGPAHRFAYELLVGPIPEGLQLDHLCRVTLCVNPQHLEPVTPGENCRRAHAFRKLETSPPLATVLVLSQIARDLRVSLSSLLRDAA